MNEKLKKILKTIIPNIYFSLSIKNKISKFNKIKDKKKYTIDLYKKKYGVDFDLDNPTTFYEKISYLKLFYKEKDPEVLIDKYLVKEYLSKLGYKDNIAKLIDSFETFKDFKRYISNKENKDKQFVVKLNHTSGEVFFYNKGTWKDKKGNKISKRIVYACLRQKIKYNYAYNSFEMIYWNVKPRIIIEEYLDTLNNGGLDEFKMFCNYGEIKLINIVKGRQQGNKVHEAFVDENLKKFPVHQDQLDLSQEEIYKPKCFDKMIEFCKKTVSDRPLIRVDFMVKDDKFYFCEFTFYDCSGVNIFYPLEYNKKIGDLFIFK